jgi:NADPH:quinone reductase-like Zn-dependent oxidoreductase
MADLIKMLALSPFVSQKLVVFMARLSKKDLTVVRELMMSGKVTPVIDRRYRLSEVPEAIRYLEAGHARGKVVIAMAS